MSIVFNSNISALKSQQSLTKSSESLNKALEKLASGKKINRAKDDAANLQIASKLVSQMLGNDEALQNAQDGANALDVLEGAYSSANEGLQRIRELTVQAANDTLGTDERAAINAEISSVSQGIETTIRSASFNGKPFISQAEYDSGGTGATFNLQIGSSGNPVTDTLDASTFATRLDGIRNNFSPSLGSGPAPITTSSSARSFLNTIDTTLTELGNRRSQLGATQNRISSAVSNLSVTSENLASAHSRIVDVDVAQESANLVKYQILKKSSISLLSQANQNPGLALSLVRSK